MKPEPALIGCDYEQSDLFEVFFVAAFFPRVPTRNLRYQKLMQSKSTEGFEISFNPFTAQACKISGLKHAPTRQQTVYFQIL